jgi:hypothetical protein
VYRRRSASMAVTAILAASEVLLVTASAIAVNAATTEPPAWPAFLSALPLSPFWGMIGSITATTALAVVLAIRQFRLDPAPGVGSSEQSTVHNVAPAPMILPIGTVIPSTTKRAWLVIEHYIEQGEATRVVVVPLPMEPRGPVQAEGRDGS